MNSGSCSQIVFVVSSYLADNNESSALAKFHQMCHFR